MSKIVTEVARNDFEKDWIIVPQNRQDLAAYKVATRDRDAIIWPYSALVRLPLDYCVQVLVPRAQERRRQTGEGPEKDHEDEQRAGEPALCGRTEGDRSFLHREEKAQRGPHYSILVLTEQLQTGQRLSRQGAVGTSCTMIGFISI